MPMVSAGLKRGGLVMRYGSQTFAAWTRPMNRVNHGCEAWNMPKCARFERSRKCLRWEGYS